MTQHYQDNLGGWHVLDDVQYEHLLTKNNPSLTFTAKTQAEFDAAIAPTLAKVQEERCAAMDSAYGAAVTANIDYMGYTFQADLDSQVLIANVLGAQGGTAPAGFGWYDITNTKVAMTNAELQGLANAIFLRGQPLFDQKQTRKASIRAATTIAEVQVIVW